MEHLLLNYKTQRQTDMMREEKLAHAERMIRAKTLADSSATIQPNNAAIYAPVMAKIGETLVNIGEALRERYGHLSEPINSAMPKANQQTMA